LLASLDRMGEAVFFVSGTATRQFLERFLVPCWGVFLAVYLICFYWIVSYQVWVHAFVVLVFSLLFPLLFLLHHFLTLKIRSRTVETAAAFGIFLAFELIMSRVPAMESLGFDIFFQPPVAMLCVLKFIHFKVWSSWVFATCFAIASWVREKRIKSLVLVGVLLGGWRRLCCSRRFRADPLWRIRGGRSRSLWCSITCHIRKHGGSAIQMK